MYFRFIEDWGVTVAVITPKDKSWVGKDKIRTVEKLVRKSLRAIQTYEYDYFQALKYEKECVLIWIEEPDEQAAKYKIAILMQHIIENYKDWREIWLIRDLQKE